MSFLSGRIAAPALCGAVLSLVVAHGASAASFVPVTQQRSVAIGANVNITNLQEPWGGEGSASDSDTAAAGNFGAWAGDVRLDNVALGDVGIVRARAMQSSVIGAESISFAGLTDINVQLIGTGDIITGGGSATTYFNFSFDLTEARVVRLEMSTTARGPGAQFGAGLYGPGGTTVWSGSSVEQPDVPAVYGFSGSFALAAGRYSGGASFTNMFALDGGGDGLAQAMFSVTAVPEPESMAMWAGGLVMLVGALRRRQRGGSTH